MSTELALVSEPPLWSQPCLQEAGEVFGRHLGVRIGLLLLGLGPLLLAGCTSTPPTQPVAVPTSTASTTKLPSPSAPVAVPSHLRGEISRDVYTDTRYDGRIGEVPRHTKVLLLHLACAGPAGSHMRYEIQDGKGGTFSTGITPCDRREHLDTDEGTAFPPTAVIHLDADRNVANGWAILTHS